MGGIVGRLFREFAVTLTVAISVSMVVSLTATPMMCAHLLKKRTCHGWFYRTSERFFEAIVEFLRMDADGRAENAFITLLVLLAT